MSADIVRKIGDEGMKSDVPDFQIGDTVSVHVKIREGDKERVQVFTGYVLARDGGGGTETYTVRRVSHGVGVERVFPLHSPYIEKIEVVRSAHVRRAKLYYQRGLTGRKARLKEKIVAKK